MVEEQILNEKELEENVVEEVVEEQVTEEQVVEEQVSKAEKGKKPTLVFAILSMVLGHLADYSIFGIIFGIIGIVFGVKNRDKSDTPLALSIVGTTLGTINFVTIILSYVMLAFYYLFIILYIVFMFTMIGVGSSTSGGTYY